MYSNATVISTTSFLSSVLIRICGTKTIDMCYLGNNHTPLIAQTLLITRNDTWSCLGQYVLFKTKGGPHTKSFRIPVASLRGINKEIKHSGP